MLIKTDRPFWVPAGTHDHGVCQHWAWTLAFGCMACVMTWCLWHNFTIMFLADGLFLLLHCEGWAGCSVLFFLIWCLHTLCYLFLTNRDVPVSSVWEQGTFPWNELRASVLMLTIFLSSCLSVFLSKQHFQSCSGTILLWSLYHYLFGYTV